MNRINFFLNNNKVDNIFNQNNNKLCFYFIQFVKNNLKKAKKKIIYLLFWHSVKKFNKKR